jgi:hypothetical protein
MIRQGVRRKVSGGDRVLYSEAQVYRIHFSIWMSLAMGAAVVKQRDLFD